MSATNSPADFAARPVIDALSITRDDPPCPESQATMKQALRDNWEFVKQFRERFHTTGAVLPSSRFLARAMTQPLRERTAPKRVLEVGPGTGAVTRYIAPQIGPEDCFDLVEINDRFAGLLRERFATDPRYQPAASRSQIHVCPLQEFRSEAPYDAIISGLPFNNFSAQLVGELVDACFNLLAPGGTFTFFEYMYIRPFKRAVLRGAEQARLTEIEHLLQGRFRDHRFRRNWVFVNVPPAWVQHLQKEPRAAVVRIFATEARRVRKDSSCRLSSVPPWWIPLTRVSPSASLAGKRTVCCLTDPMAHCRRSPLSGVPRHALAACSAALRQFCRCGGDWTGTDPAVA